MAFKEGGMVSGLLIIAVSIVFAAGFGFLILHFVPGTPFWQVNLILKNSDNYILTASRSWTEFTSALLFLTL